VDRITLSAGSGAGAGILQHFNNDAGYNKNPGNHTNDPGHIGYSGNDNPGNYHVNGADCYNSNDDRS
jgi:hypothetical protein